MTECGLTMEQQEAIRKASREGVRASILAIRYNVSFATIYRIIAQDWVDDNDTCTQTGEYGKDGA